MNLSYNCSSKWIKIIHICYAFSKTDHGPNKRKHMLGAILRYKQVLGLIYYNKVLGLVVAIFIHKDSIIVAPNLKHK